MSPLANLFSLPPRSSSKLRYARYVGRVGALAVSLEYARVTLQHCLVSDWADTCCHDDAALTRS